MPLRSKASGHLDAVKDAGQIDVHAFPPPFFLSHDAGIVHPQIDGFRLKKGRGRLPEAGHCLHGGHVASLEVDVVGTMLLAQNLTGVLPKVLVDVRKTNAVVTFRNSNSRIELKQEDE